MFGNAICVMDILKYSVTHIYGTSHPKYNALTFKLLTGILHGLIEQHL